MPGLCSLFGHSYDGCRCRRCQADRHSWVGCKCTRCGKVDDSAHCWKGCRCETCGQSRDEDHLWKGRVCQVCGARWTPPAAALVIDESACGEFAEVDLRPWMLGQKRSSNSIREDLAAATGLPRNASIAMMVRELMIPVFTAQQGHLAALTTGPEVEGKAEIEAKAWLQTGANLDLPPFSPALFVLYYMRWRVAGEIADLVFQAIGDEIKDRKPSFMSGAYERDGDVGSYALREILDQRQPGKYAAEVMGGAVSWV